MKNSNDLKTFTPVVFGGGGIVSKGGNTGSFGDGTAYTPGINPGSGGQYNQNTGVVYKGTLSKTIEVVDKNGDPLSGAHITWNEGGKTVGTTTTNLGEATVSVPSESTQITITYLGKRTHIATFANLGSLITLQDNVNSLPPVVVGQPTKPTTTTTAPTTTNTEVKKTNWVKTAAIGVGALLLISTLSKSGGKKNKSSNSNGNAMGLSGTKSKKRKNKKAKGKKRKGLREPATEVTL